MYILNCFDIGRVFVNNVYIYSVCVCAMKQDIFFYNKQAFKVNL